jgi:monoamine oxidase
MAEWTYATGADRDAIRRFFKDNEGEFMAPVTEISMAAAALTSALTTNDRAFRLRDGTASLPEAMASHLGRASVCLEEPVVAITLRENSAVVRTSKRVLVFDAVVLALPLPALSRVGVEPDLRLSWIGSGRGGKLMVPYDNAALGPAAEVSVGTGMKFVYANASHQAGGGTILTAYSDHVLDATEVESTFSRWFPNLVRSPMPPVAAWWSLDPYSGATYSAPQPGYLDALDDLRKPHGRAVFAGEHTEILFGYVESALVSGRRAAALVNNLP